MAILIILLILVFAGNAFLFSGALTGDLAGNSIAIILVLLAVAADIAFIYWIIKGIVKRVDESRQQKKLAKANAVKAEINSFIRKHRLSDTPVFSRPPEKKRLSGIQYDPAILSQVEAHWNDTAAIRNASVALHRQNEAILACPNCSSDEQRLEYLHGKTAELEHQAATLGELVNQCDKYRISLPNTEGNEVIQLQNALKRAKNSRKTKGIESLQIIDSNDSAKRPRELSCFRGDMRPLSLVIKQFTFCVFPRVILVFDTGAFVTALSPSELKITVSPIIDNVVLSNGKYSSDIVDTDSKCIQQGASRKTWLHTRKNGSPDLRYSYNPSSEYRVDSVAYGRVQFTILGSTAMFYFSSYAAIDALDIAIKKYLGTAHAVEVHQVDDAPQVNDAMASSVNVHSKLAQSTNATSHNISAVRTSSRLPDKIKLYKTSFAACRTPEEIIQKYITMNDQTVLTKTIEIEILRYYLQHNSAFTARTWTYTDVLSMVETSLGIVHTGKPVIQHSQQANDNTDEATFGEPIPAPSGMPSEERPIRITEDSDYLQFEIVVEDKPTKTPVFEPQKIDYGKRKSPEAEKTIFHSRFEQMRRIEAPRSNAFTINGLSFSASGGIGNAAQFVAQAKFMADYTDDYSDHVDFQCYYPTYMSMDDKQLHTYFAWRTKVKAGQIDNIDLSYVFVYVYELLNMIGVASAEEGLAQLVKFWSAFRIYSNKLDVYLKRWVKEFYVYYRIPSAFSDIALQFPSDIPQDLFAQEEIFNHRYKNIDKYLDQLSSHKFLSSKFYESELGYTLLECIPLVLNAVDAFFQAREVSFPSLLLGSTIREDYWRPFNGAVVDVHNPSENYSVKISLLEEYSFTNGKWQSQRLQPNFFSNLLGYIIKTVEAELRDLTGYKRKLKPNINNITHDNIQDKHIQAMIYDPMFTETIRDTTRAYFAQSGIRPEAFKIAAQDDSVSVKPVEVRVDFSKLEAIRAAAAEIQERLVIDEPACVDDCPDVAPISIMPQIPHTQMEHKSEADDAPLKNPLSEQQRLCLRAILSGKEVNSRVAEIAKESGMLPELLLESINDTLFETFGDNIIDAAGDEPYIYDDYIDELTKTIEEA